MGWYTDKAVIGKIDNSNPDIKDTILNPTSVTKPGIKMPGSCSSSPAPVQANDSDDDAFFKSFVDSVKKDALSSLNNELGDIGGFIKSELGNVKNPNGFILGENKFGLSNFSIPGFTLPELKIPGMGDFPSLGLDLGFDLPELSNPFSELDLPSINLDSIGLSTFGSLPLADGLKTVTSFGEDLASKTLSGLVDVAVKDPKSLIDSSKSLLKTDLGALTKNITGLVNSKDVMANLKSGAIQNLIEPENIFNLTGAVMNGNVGAIATNIGSAAGSSITKNATSTFSNISSSLPKLF